ncbi:hypothetical protein S83_039023 [Arachis hypogaea]
MCRTKQSLCCLKFNISLTTWVLTLARKKLQKKNEEKRCFFPTPLTKNVTRTNSLEGIKERSFFSLFVLKLDSSINLGGPLPLCESFAEFAPSGVASFSFLCMRFLCFG